MWTTFYLVLVASLHSFVFAFPVSDAPDEEEERRMTSEIIVSLWAGTNGFLDKIATKEILRFEALWLDHLKSTRATTLEEIMVKKQMTDEITTGFKTAMDEFLGMNEFEARAA